MKTKSAFLPRHIVFCGLVCICLCLPCQALSAEMEIPSTFNPVGSGARAIGMGGAFIAVADDATAASWNPGGLSQLKKPETSVVLNGFHRSEDIRFGLHPEGDGSHSLDQQDLNYLSITYPFEWLDRNMVFSLAYQHLYDFNRNWEYDIYQQNNSLSLSDHLNFRQKGALSAIGLSYCIRILPQLSLGLTWNIWDDDLSPNKWTLNHHKTGTGTLGSNELSREVYKKDSFELEGMNFNLGLLWRVNYRLTLGAVLKTPFSADIRHKIQSRSFLYAPREEIDIENKQMNEKMDMPMSYGIGINYTFSDNFSVSGDIYKTHWEDMVYTDEAGYETSPLTGNSVSQSKIDPTYQVRIGAEYRYINAEKGYLIPFRGGLFYDPAPAYGGSEDFYGISLGIGFTLNDRFSLDMAYQYRFGEDVGDSIYRHFDFSQDVREHMLYISLILYKF